MNKLFIITRADLPPGAVAAQSVHGAFAFAHEHVFKWRTWFLSSNNLVLLAVPDEAGLLELARRIGEAGFATSVFREPDFGDSVTSVAVEPDAWKLVSSLPCALRPKKNTKDVAIRLNQKDASEHVSD